mmetsp:Transcript_10320/g.24807  ORF Transcript_10320/g.24807 Transcript_10320/m.24807 type:complete len:139 (-) Transcript_10320:424-840(-)
MSTDWRLAGSAVAIPALAWLCMAVDSTGSSQALDHLPGKNLGFISIQCGSSLGQHLGAGPEASLGLQEAPGHEESGKPFARHGDICAFCLRESTTTQPALPINPNFQLLLHGLLDVLSSILESFAGFVEAKVVLLCQR